MNEKTNLTVDEYGISLDLSPEDYRRLMMGSEIGISRFTVFTKRGTEDTEATVFEIQKM